MRAGHSDFCFVHAADLHLGARRWLTTGPSDAGLAERVQLADRLALANLIDLCLAERPRLLLCAGDIIDGWCRDYTVGLYFVQELLRLRGSGCKVVLLLGNHDARTRVIRPLLLPEHTRILGDGAPETRVFGRLGVAVHGWSCPQVSGPCDVAGLYPAPVPGLFNIGLLHTSAEGRRGHLDYAPCSRRTLRHHGYDYWALGHVHAREVIAEEPWVVFPGNLQARGAREAGPKGASIVRVREGRVAAVEHRALDAVRFAGLDVEMDRAAHFDDVLEALWGALADAHRWHAHPAVIASVRIRGARAVSAALSVSATARARAIAAVTKKCESSHFFVEEVLLDAGADLGCWSVPFAA